MAPPDSIHRSRDGRWETRFGQWVDLIGVFRIVEALGEDPSLSVTSHAVYDWLRGECAPNPKRAIALVELSGGEITLDAIYRHRAEMQRAEREEKQRDTRGTHDGTQG